MLAGPNRSSALPLHARAAAAVLLCAGAALAPAAAAAHCAGGEQTVFACAAGAHMLAVCASPALDAATGWLQYRYGRAGAVELRLPPAHTPADAWRRATRGGALAYSGGGGAYLAFTHAPYRYVVFTASGRGWGHKAGVIVERGGQRIAYRACTGPATSQLGPELFERAGIRLIEEDLVLP